MTCQEIDQSLALYLYDELSAADHEAAGEHLACCERCREALDQLRGADEELLDNLLVVFHRGTLRDDKRDDPRARRSELVDAEHPVGNADWRIGVLDHRVFLADDLGRQLGQGLGQACEHAVAMLRGNVVGDDRTERKYVEAAVGLDWHEQFERRAARLGKRARHLAQREIFLERGRVKLMSPARQTNSPDVVVNYFESGASKTIKKKKATEQIIPSHHGLNGIGNKIKITIAHQGQPVFVFFVGSIFNAGSRRFSLDSLLSICQ